VPMLQIQTLPINPATLQLAVRGISNLDVSQMTRESPVAVYVDGVYLGRTQGLALDLPDLERIELLRGPQGTLFGRNAVGGALNIVTQKPTGNFEGYITAGAGNYGSTQVRGNINLPKIGIFSIALSGVLQGHDGYINSVADPHHRLEPTFAQRLVQAGAADDVHPAGRGHLSRQQSGRRLGTGHHVRLLRRYAESTQLSGHLRRRSGSVVRDVGQLHAVAASGIKTLDGAGHRMVADVDDTVQVQGGEVVGLVEGTLSH